MDLTTTKQFDDLFFTCSFIEFLGRETKNKRADVVKALGEPLIKKLYSLADVYHCDNILAVKEEFLKEANLPDGTFDNVRDCLYGAPGFWAIGDLYARIVTRSLATENATDDAVPSLVTSVFSSRISEGIQNFNCAWYYSNPDEIFLEYEAEMTSSRT